MTMTDILIQQLIPLLWLAWCLYWWISARDTKATVRLETVGSRYRHIAPLVMGALLIGLPALRLPVLGAYILPPDWAQYVIGVVLTIAGLGFTVWARRTLGRNWSGLVTVKADHELIRTGPYALVRHPIYTGLLLAFVGSAIARDQWRAVLGLLMIVIGLWRKLKLEERWMTETFGEAYARYRQEVRALVPFLI